MSYLLTEIALEMLGYKFFDVYGHYGPTDFQNIPYKCTKSEESLEHLLKIDGLPEILPKPEEKLQILNESTSEKLMKNLINSDSDKGKTSTQLPTATDLIDSENKKLRNEIQNNITNYMESKRNNSANNDFDEIYIYQELINEQQIDLRNEAQVMREFRLFAEQKLAKINPELFKVYNRTFNEHNRNEKNSLIERS